MILKSRWLINLFSSGKLKWPDHIIMDVSKRQVFLDMDSLDGVDLVVALEKTFACRIPEEEARGIRTLGDIYAKVQAGLARTANDPAPQDPIAQERVG